MHYDFRMPTVRKSLIDAVLGPGYVTPRVKKPIKKKTTSAAKQVRRFPDELVLEVRRLWSNEGLPIARIIKRISDCGFEVSAIQVQNWVMYRSRDTPEMRPTPNCKPYLQPKPLPKPKESP